MAQPTYESKAPAPSRKRSDISEDGDEGGGKKRSRGRPRLETKDETAVDRRRTQIRLAQRAYRNRKDSAIDTLKKKVKELEQVNEDMGREFLNLSQFVITNGMVNGSPEVAQRLSEATRRFHALSRKLNDEGTEDDDTNGSDIPSDIPSQTPTRESPKLTPSDSTPSITDTRSTPPTEFSNELVPASNLQLQVQQAPPDPFQKFDPLAHSPVDSLTRPSSVDSSFPFADNKASISLFREATHSPFSTLPLPNSFATQERTFGRRYQRAAVEAGLSLALMPNPPPDRYMAVFSFCLQFESRQDIIRRLSITLDKTRNESLNNWQFPFSNLGGAGTWLQCHVQRPITGDELPVGNYGLPEPYKPTEFTGFPTGPFKEDVELVRDVRVDHRMQMLHPGFEGEFFDADEVDGYLRQHGLLILEGKDFVDANLDLEAFERPPDLPPRNFLQRGLGYVNQGSTTGVAPDASAAYTSGIEATGNEWSATVTTSMEPLTLMNNGIGMPAFDSTLGSLDVGLLDAANNQEFGQGMPDFSNMFTMSWRAWEPPPAPKRTKVTIDVNRLVTELVMRSSCLGRSPGIRPKDVNTAVKLSIVLQDTESY